MSTELSVTTDKSQKFFNDLQTQRSNLSTCIDLFKTLTTHFTSLQETLSRRTRSLDSKCQSLDTQYNETLASLVLRENSIPERETSMTAAVEEMKAAALNDLESTQKHESLSDMLKSLCRRMDSSGLVRFLLSRRKDSAVLRLELPGALKEGIDPGRLVLDVVDEFLSRRDDKAGLADKRWGCLILAHSLFVEEKIRKGTEFSSSVVERAAGILDRWWKLEGGNGGREGCDGIVGPVEAVTFLQLAVGFGLQEEFDKEFMKKLVLENAARREMVNIAAKIDFGEEMGDIIDKMVKTGNEIDAVYFACKTGMTERFPPVSLLKSYIKNSKKAADTILKNGNYSSAATEDSNQMELNSIKAVIKCLEDNKLESVFPHENLKNRANKLEETKAEKRKRLAASASKSQKKRNRCSSGKRDSGSPAFHSAKRPKIPKAYSPFSHRNTMPPLQRSPAARYAATYAPTKPSVYESHIPSVYASTYHFAHSQSPASISQQQYVPSVDNTSGGFSAGSSYASQSAATYGAYEYGSSGGVPIYQP